MSQPQSRPGSLVDPQEGQSSLNPNHQQEPSPEAAGKMMKAPFPQKNRMNTEQPRSQAVQFQGQASLRKDGLAIGEMTASNQHNEEQAELDQELMGGRPRLGNEEPLIVQLTAIPDDEDSREHREPSGRREGKDKDKRLRFKAPIRWQPSDADLEAFHAALLEAKPMVALKL